MKLSETAQVLALVQSFNNRTVGEKDVIAWQSVMADVDVADAEEAVRRHFTESAEWIMPVHVRNLVRDIVQERKSASEATGWAPGQAGVPKDQALPEVTAGDAPGPFADALQKAVTSSVAAILAEIRRNLPQGSRETLMPRRVAWEREHVAYLRTQNAQPNPFYRPKAAADPARDSDGFCNDTDCPGHPHGPARAEPETADYHPHAAFKPKVACDLHEEGGCYPVAVPGYGAEGCDCPMPEKVSESCPLHGFKPNPSDQ